jgi:hypothetical protein
LDFPPPMQPQYPQMPMPQMPPEIPPQALPLQNLMPEQTPRDEHGRFRKK